MAFAYTRAMPSFGNGESPIYLPIRAHRACLRILSPAGGEELARARAFTQPIFKVGTARCGQRDAGCALRARVELSLPYTRCGPAGLWLVAFSFQLNNFFPIKQILIFSFIVYKY